MLYKWDCKHNYIVQMGMQRYWPLTTEELAVPQFFSSRIPSG